MSIPGISVPTGPLEDIDLGPLSGSLGFLLRLPQLKNFQGFYDKLGTSGLRPGEFSVLVIIGRNPEIRQGVLARRLFIKRAHMTKLVRSMERRGHLCRRTPASDRRAVALTLTDAGSAFVAEHAAAVYGFGEAEELSSTERKKLVSLLQKHLGLKPGPGQAA